MELLVNAKVIRLKSHHNKYLLAKEDDESVCQDKKGKSSKTARWNVEFVQGGKFIRLRNCYGKYLTASDASFLLGMTGKKVVQTLPTLDSSSFSSFEWEPIRDGDNKQIKLKSRCGDYLRANGHLPPWRNSVTHDVPHRNKTQDWILWDVDVLEIIQIQPVVEEAVAVAVEVAVEVAVAVAEEAVEVEVEVVIKEEEAAAAAALEGGSSSSISGFRKFLHELNGGGDGESSGGLLAGIIGGLTA